MVKTLVIGSSGWIGSYLVSSNSSFYPRSTLPKLTSNQFREWINNQSPDNYINCVGKFSGSESEMEWANIGILELILKRASETGARVFSLGSAAEYGDQKQLLLPEDSMTSPISLYGKQKLIANDLLHSYISMGVNAMNLRLFNVIGPKQSSKTALGEIITKLKNIRSETEFILNDYDVTRDYLSLGFVNEVINFLAKTDFKGTLNVGSGHPTKLLDLVTEIASSFNVEISLGNLNANRVESVIADVTRLKELGLTPPKLSLPEMSRIVAIQAM